MTDVGQLFEIIIGNRIKSIQNDGLACWWETFGWFFFSSSSGEGGGDAAENFFVEKRLSEFENTPPSAAVVWLLWLLWLLWLWPALALASLGFFLPFSFYRLKSRKYFEQRGKSRSLRNAKLGPWSKRQAGSSAFLYLISVSCIPFISSRTFHHYHRQSPPSHHITSHHQPLAFCRFLFFFV